MEGVPHADRGDDGHIAVDGLRHARQLIDTEIAIFDEVRAELEEAPR